MARYNLGIGPGPERGLWDRFGLYSNPQARATVMGVIRRVHDVEQTAHIAGGGRPNYLFASINHRTNFNVGVTAEIPNLPASIQGHPQAQLVQWMRDLCRFYRAYDPTSWGLSAPAVAGW